MRFGGGGRLLGWVVVVEVVEVEVQVEQQQQQEGLADPRVDKPNT